MGQKDPTLRIIWKQARIPVVYRQARPKPILVRLPFSPDNYSWLRGNHHHRPKWDRQHKCWETPAAWFDDLIRRVLNRYRQVYVIQVHREQQKCAPACWNAKGFHCECSCMGVRHGTGDPGGNWHAVSENFAFQWGPRQYACRLIVARGDD
jgi:hypothetical protein